MKSLKLALFVVVTVAMFAVYADAAFAAPRVLIVGDETVVEAAAQPYGFVNELRKTLAAENRDVEIVPLGVRRSTFEDWRALIAKSRDEDPPIDVEGVSLKTELDKGADLVFVFLGLNNVLNPAFSGVFRESDVARRGQASPAQEKLRDEIVGLVDDLKSRASGVKRVVLVAPAPGTDSGAISSQLYTMNSLIEQAATKASCQVFRLQRVFETPQTLAWFANDQIDLYRDGLRPNEYGSQLITWALLVAFDARGFFELEDRARVRYAGPPKSLRQRDTDKPSEWEEIARRYYENSLDPRLRDFVSPGFCLSAHYSELNPYFELNPLLSPKDENAPASEDSTPNPIRVKVMCSTRGIEADQPVDEDKFEEASQLSSSAFAPVSKTPKIDVVSCGKFIYKGINLGMSHGHL